MWWVRLDHDGGSFIAVELFRLFENFLNFPSVLEIGRKLLFFGVEQVVEHVFSLEPEPEDSGYFSEICVEQQLFNLLPSDIFGFSNLLVDVSAGGLKLLYLVDIVLDSSIERIGSFVQKVVTV